MIAPRLTPTPAARHRPRPATALPGLALCTLAAIAAPGLRPALALAADPVRNGDAAQAVETPAALQRVAAFSGIEGLDGGAGAATATPARWRAALDELYRAHGAPSAWPDPRRRDFSAGARPGAIRLGLLDLPYALDLAAGVPTVAPGSAHRAFAFAPIEPRTWRGGDLSIRLDSAFMAVDWRGAPPALEFDAGEGLGFRPIAPGRAQAVAYPVAGPRTLRLRATYADGQVRLASTTLAVEGLETPAPHDTLLATGALYAGGTATGRGYVYLAPGRTAIENPVIVVEGFDLDNSTGWDEIYALLSAEDLIESLRQDGYDLVALDFTDATDFVQRNAFVLVDLIAQVRARMSPGRRIALAGASMGGLVARYALAHMEALGVPHDVRTFIAFDAPQQGANIPLGIQYWFEFFATESAEAAALRDVLNTPAARQMLVYHFTVPASSSGAPDPMKGVLEGELAALGYPALSRNVAIANGSGRGGSQGFAPADQLIAWNYDIGIAVVRGNVWAVPDGGPAQIFDGRQFVLFQTNRTLSVTVSGTSPYDGAPGGSRNTMQQMDEVEAPVGDIIALHPSHCFIPSVSALDFAASGLFHDILAEPDPLAFTPFDAIYLPDSNEAHVSINAANAAWIRAEIGAGLVAVPAGDERSGIRLAVAPNPFAGAARITYTLPRAGEARVEVFGVDGRRVATLAGRHHAAGTHGVAWDGRDERGLSVGAGVYFVRLEVPGGVRVARLVHTR